MKKNCILLIALAVISFVAFRAEARNYKFNIDNTAETRLVRKHKDPSFKIVRVVAVDKNFDKAMDRGAMCVVADALFRGIPGSIDPVSQESVPGMKAMLPENIGAYNGNKTFFDTFFKKGHFTQFVRRALTDFPTGENNVKTKQGTRIVDYYILNTQALTQYLLQNGIEAREDKLKF